METKTKHSLSVYSMNIPEDDYHAYPAWSHSKISKYAEKGFEALATLHEKTEPTPSMEFGSLFDSMLTKGKKTLEEYTVMKKEVPNAEKQVLVVLARKMLSPDLASVSKEAISDACIECKYQPGWGYDAKYRHLFEHADYYRSLCMGKKIVSEKDWTDAVEMMRVFRADPYISTLFGTKSTDDIEYLYQTQFLVDWITDDGQTVKIKVMPDLIVVNHKEKTIQPVDLKTSFVPAWNFKENFIKYHYEHQACMYTYALEQIIKNDEYYKDFEILKYLFVDISRSDKVPVTYVYDQYAQSDGMQFKNYKYKNWQTLLNEIIRYENSNAVVPDYIRRDGPNDLIEILNR